MYLEILFFLVKALCIVLALIPSIGIIVACNMRNSEKIVNGLAYLFVALLAVLFIVLALAHNEMTYYFQGIIDKAHEAAPRAPRS